MAANAETLQLWTQIIGKVRLASTPWLNHSWHVTLYLTACGLTTGPIAHGSHTFEIRFDFIDHHLRILKSDGGQRKIELRAQTVAEFYRAVIEALGGLELPTQINMLPNETTEPIRFDQDETHRSYDREYANRFWRVLLQSHRVFQKFRSGFIGKCSPVHFFWGSFDLAVTRFSGRTAPAHPGGVPHLPNAVAQEAYSHEVSSLGFWPGSAAMPEPIFYSYAYPSPAGFADAKVEPSAASWNATLKEFVLPYEAVRVATNGGDLVLAFAQSTYEATAPAGHLGSRSARASRRLAEVAAASCRAVRRIITNL